MTIRMFGVGTTIALILTIYTSSLSSQEKVFTIDQTASRIVITVGRAGLFGFAGHTHEVIAPAVRGQLRLDQQDATASSVWLEFDASALEVSGRGEPAEDVPEVQRVMLSEQVLDVERFPTIRYESRAVAVTEMAEDRLVLTVAGDLTLHGVAQPVTTAVSVSITADQVTVQGTVEIKQSEFGIEPPRAAAGLVRVKDELHVLFIIHFRPEGLTERVSRVGTPRGGWWHPDIRGRIVETRSPAAPLSRYNRPVSRPPCP